MPRKPEAYLMTLDNEIERILKNLREITSVESINMANQRERLHAIPKEEK